MLACALWLAAGCGSEAGTADTAAATADTATTDAAVTDVVDIATADSAADVPPSDAQLGQDATATDADAKTADATATDTASPADAAADVATVKAGLVLNEIGAKGAAIGNWNPTGSDWLELYNNSDAEIDLKGFVTVDKKSFDLAGQLPPGTKIAAKGYLIVWFNHTGFGSPNIDKGISSPGSASVFAPDGKLVDTTTWVSGASPAGGSWARASDGGLPWKTFTVATPGTTNKP